MHQLIKKSLGKNDCQEKRDGGLLSNKIKLFSKIVWHYY